MLGISLLDLTLLVSAAVALALIGLLVYRAAIASCDESDLFLNRTEAAQLAHLDEVRRISRLDLIIKEFALAFGVFVILLLAIWVHRGLYGPIVL
jgi:hypothetical protein